MRSKYTNESVENLRQHGYGVLESGGAVIVIGERGSIPIDRPTGVMDLMRSTTARRFDSAKEAVALLVGKDEGKDPAISALEKQDEKEAQP